MRSRPNADVNGRAKAVGACSYLIALAEIAPGGGAAGDVYKRQVIAHAALTKDHHRLRAREGFHRDAALYVQLYPAGLCSPCLLYTSRCV